MNCLSCEKKLERRKYEPRSSFLNRMFCDKTCRDEYRRKGNGIMVTMLHDNVQVGIVNKGREAIDDWKSKVSKAKESAQYADAICSRNYLNKCAK